LKPGDLRVAADVGFMLRGPVTTQQSLGAGQEFTAALAVGYSLLDDHVSPTAVLLARTGIEAEYAGVWSAPVEVLVGAQGMITKEWYVDAFAGRGLTSGYGATDLRAIIAVTYNKMPPKEKGEEKAAPVAVFESDVTDEDLNKIIEEPEPEPPKELATVTQREIVAPVARGTQPRLGHENPAPVERRGAGNSWPGHAARHRRIAV